LLPVVPAAHEWASLGVISPEGLIGAPLVMRERGSGSRHIVENGLQIAGLRLQSLRIVMELDSTEAILSCTEEQPNDKRGERESEDNHEVHLVEG
jgi:LysR family transcriptional regulator, transcriptional activator of the cysJI operon